MLFSGFSVQTLIDFKLFKDTEKTHINMLEVTFKWTKKDESKNYATRNPEDEK